MSDEFIWLVKWLKLMLKLFHNFPVRFAKIEPPKLLLTFNMPTTPSLPSQINFGFLSVPDLRPVTFEQDSMDHDAFTPSGSSNSQKEARQDQEAYVPVNYISPEAYALLAAAEASATLRADALDEGVTELDANGHSSTLQSVLDYWYQHEGAVQIMAPPKRFYRIFWQSISRQLLDRWSHMTLPS